MNVKIIICLALVFICLNEAVAQKGKKGKGMMPCGAKDNVEECTCEDGVTYPAEEVKESCGKANDNKLKSCVCVDGTTWTRPEKPCGGKKNVTECVCQDGEKYSGKEIIKKCIIMKNPIETCNCEDGTTWTPKN